MISRAQCKKLAMSAIITGHNNLRFSGEQRSFFSSADVAEIGKSTGQSHDVKDAHLHPLSHLLTLFLTLFLTLLLLTLFLC